MYSYKAIKIVFAFIVYFNLTFNIGEAIASPKSYTGPVNTQERIEYAIALNSIATTLMNWYGSLLDSDYRTTGAGKPGNTNISFSLIDKSWSDYRSTYPEKITGIQITNADLRKQTVSGQYQFEVEVLITFMESDKKTDRIINETFLFHVSTTSKPVISNITRASDRLENNSNNINQSSAFRHEYYKSREFAYAWLTLMDGINFMGSHINMVNWMGTASYSVKIGNFKLDGQLLSSLKKRNQHLGRGGHLLRSVTAKALENKPHHFELDLVIDWKGMTPDGKPALAKINQVIHYKLQEDGTLIVLAVNEKHMLPDMEPWQKLLC
ncbi:MAG: hypothetical protein MI673_04405 [Thiotrichales bacterium]|nr:hypothetical protein [Thiotrichales bacterium]